MNVILTKKKKNESHLILLILFGHLDRSLGGRKDLYSNLAVTGQCAEWRSDQITQAEIHEKNFTLCLAKKTALSNARSLVCQDCFFFPPSTDLLQWAYYLEKFRALLMAVALVEDKQCWC